MRHETENGGLVRGFLDDTGRFQAAAIAFVHQPVIERWSFPARKPYEWGVDQVTQPEFLYFAQGMTFGRREFDMLNRNRKLVQLLIVTGQVKHKPGVHTA